MGTSKNKAKSHIRLFSQKIDVGSLVPEALGVQSHHVEPGPRAVSVTRVRGEPLDPALDDHVSQGLSAPTASAAHGLPTMNPCTGTHPAPQEALRGAGGRGSTTGGRVQTRAGLPRPAVCTPGQPRTQVAQGSSPGGSEPKGDYKQGNV